MKLVPHRLAIAFGKSFVSLRVLAADDFAAEVLHDVIDRAVAVTARCGCGGVHLRLQGPNHGWYIIQL